MRSELKLAALSVLTVMACGPDTSALVDDVEVDSEFSESQSALNAPPRPPASVVAMAVAAPLGAFGINAAGMRYCSNCLGQSVVLALASYQGDQSADARLLEQIRYVIGQGRDPFGNGGYMSQHELMMTSMFAIAKRTPRVWSQLTPSEVTSIDLIMKGVLVGCAYTTADATNVNTVPTGIDGDTNLNRTWNPNYREGMVGAVIVSTLYLGGKANAEAFLNSYNHAAFVSALNSAGLTHMFNVFNTNVASPSAGAPTAAAIAAGIKNYRYLGLTLGQHFGMYVSLANDTFSKPVDCGLNGGQGVLVTGGQRSGYLVSGCASLPNKGVVGQLKEFASSDANGPRSSTVYALGGFKTDLANHIVLLVYGRLVSGAALTGAVDRIAVGTPDLLYKVQNGYRNYAKGVDLGVYTLPANGVADGYEYWMPLWFQVLAPVHGR